MRIPAALQRFIAGSAHSVASPTVPLAGDIAQLRSLQAMRTPAGVADALEASRLGMGVGWLPMIREATTTAPTPLSGLAAASATGGAMLLAGVRSIAAKALHGRARPYDMAVGITSAAGHAPRGSSYPSTHAAISHAAAGVLERLGNPQLAARARGLADATSLSRQYLGVHFPSDVRAGEAMGRDAAATMLRLIGRT